MRYGFIVIIFVFTSYCTFAQDPLKLDSLLTEYNFAESDVQKINVLLDISNLYRSTNFVKALEYSKQALDISLQINDKELIAKSYLRVGNMCIYIGDYDEALKNCLASLEINESLNPGKELYNNYLIIGVIYDRVHEYDIALEYYFKALNVSNELKQNDNPEKNLIDIHTLYNNVGNIYETKDENDIAIDYYKKGVEISKNVDDYHQLGVLYNNLGKIHNKLKKYDEAYEFLQNSLNARKKINDKDGMAKSYNFLCGHYFEQKNYPEAIKYAKKGYELGVEVGSIQTQHISTWFLFQIYSATNDFKKAFDKHVEYKSLSDSLLDNQTINEITRLKMQYEFDEKEATRELIDQKTRFTYLLTLSILVLGLIILALLLILVRYRSKKVKLEKCNLEKDIELKNKELTTNVMYLIQKNEMIAEISSKLLKLKSNLKEENREPVQRIIFELGNITDEAIWEEFEIRFQMVHQDFYSNLTTRFVDLTKGDQKLCAFLKLGMSSKEIASVTNQSLKSVEVARTRLRKKLELTNTDVDLIDFLNQL